MEDFEFHIPLSRGSEAQEDLDDEENLLDFTFDGEIHIGRPQGGRATILQLEKLVAGILDRQTSAIELDTALKALRAKVERAIDSHKGLIEDDPSTRDLNNQYIEAYQRSREAISYMQLYFSEARSDYLRIGLANLEGAVADIDHLIARETNK